MVINQPQAPDLTILGFHLSGKMIFFRSEAKHTDPLEPVERLTLSLLWRFSPCVVHPLKMPLPV
jgi:hypothetical protein